MVPCDPVKHLGNEYGPSKWETPLAKRYKWTNLKYVGNWSDEQWPHTIKFYDPEGKLRVNKTLDTINSYAKYNITKLPFDYD
jgi:hypothetical protein